MSANQMYAPTKKGGLCKTKKYNAWIELNRPKFEEQLLPATSFPVSVDILVMGGCDWNDARDIDNVIKPIVDLLVKAKILPDDTTKYVEDAKARFLPTLWKKSPALTVVSYTEPEEIEMEWEWPEWIKNRHTAPDCINNK